MNKILLFLSIFILLPGNEAHSQNLIVIQNGNNTSFYSQLSTAIASANNGDTINIPGGSFNGDITIDKTLHLIGNGHNSDSVVGGLITQINGNVLLIPGASNGSIRGINLKGNIVCSNTSSISNYVISRNAILQLSLSSTFAFGIISENVIYGVIDGSSGYAINNGFFNNIIGSQFYRLGPNNIFKNNIFMYPVNAGVNQVKQCVFENNIFFSGIVNYVYNNGITNCIFNNNLFIEYINIPYESNLGIDNITSQPQNSIFTNQTGINFNYDHDYNLKDTCPGKNGGTDGKDIGLYGGLYPWKDGSLPQNPQIKFKQISNTTDQNGNLQINMVVKAQNN